MEKLLDREEFPVKAGRASDIHCHPREERLRHVVGRWVVIVI